MKYLIFTLLILLQCMSVLGQVGIGTTSPDTSAILDINASDKGVLMPRLTQAQRNTISSPAIGLMIYQTDNTTGLYYYNGSSWQTFGGGDNLGNHNATQNIELNGNWLSNDGDNEGIAVTNTGNVGVNVDSPTIHLALGDTDTGFNWVGDGDFNIMANNTQAVKVRATGVFVGHQFGANTFNHELNLGDGDTGFDWTADGQFNLMANNSVVSTVTTTGLYVRPQFGATGVHELNIGDGDTGFDWVSDGRLNIMADNTIVGNATSTGLFVRPQLGATASHDLNIGDSDTGFDWVGDGEFRVMNNNGLTMSFLPNNIVGIGTETPENNLHIHQNGWGNSYLQFTNSTTGDTWWDGFTIGIDGNGDSYLWSDEASDLYIATDTEVRIFVGSDGRVGVNTFFPDTEFSVDGNASKNGGGLWWAFSDRRLKKDITSFNEGLDVLMEIDPVRFKYNGLGGNKDDGKEYIGVIAQDVQEVAPYMINSVFKKLNETDTEQTELLMYDGTALTYVLVNAIKEQQVKINQLEKKINEILNN